MGIRKEEARVLVYGICKDYAVFATYRKDFLEELAISTTKNVIYDLAEHARKILRTYYELSYVTPCTESKYVQRFRGIRVLEGSEYLENLFKYCELIYKILCVLCKHELINPPNVDLVVDVSDKCASVSGNIWLSYVPAAEG